MKAYKRKGRPVTMEVWERFNRFSRQLTWWDVKREVW